MIYPLWHCPRFFASNYKCHIRHNSSYSMSIAMATYCFNLAAILVVSVMQSSSCVITRDQQAKIADTQTLGKHVKWLIFIFLIFGIVEPKSARNQV